MDDVVTLSTTATHLYPGAVLELPQDPGPGQQEAMVLFGDGSSAEATIEPTGTSDGTLEPDDADYRLTLEPYRTAAGTELPAKTWIVRRLSSRQVKVVSRG